MKQIKHIAFIMDGNGRWAKKMGQNRTYGHKMGSQKIKEVCRWCIEAGIQYASFYAFSKENWKRPAYEVNFIFSLIQESYQTEFQELKKQNIKIIHIGDKADLSKNIVNIFTKIENETAKNTALTALLYINYSGRAEIALCIKKINESLQNGEIKIEQINEELIGKYLYTGNYPDPDLIVRTSGEKRISNFLIFQGAYSELYFEEQYWPEYSHDHFLMAVNDFQTRERRYGGL